MFRFYFSLFRDIPRVLRGTHEAWAYWILSIIVPLVLLLRPEWRPMTETPWLIAAPIAVSVLYGMLRVNYVRFRDKETELLDLQQKLDATRPRFHITESGLRDANLDPSVGKVPLHHRVMIGLAFKIEGTRRAAHDVAGWFVFAKGTLTEPPLLVGPLDTGYDEQRALDIKPWLPQSVTVPNTPPCFMAMEIRYLDAQTGLRDRQTWYLKWDGVNSGGVLYSDFVNLPRRDTDRFVVYLNQQLSKQLPGGWER